MRITSRSISAILLLSLILVPSPLYAQAVYKGHIYNAPVCNNPNCVMCNYIRSQLQSAQAQLHTQSAQALPLTTRTYDVATQSSSPLYSVQASTQSSYSVQPSTFASQPSYSDVYTPVQPYKYVQVPYTVRVKRCNGVTCWYENITQYRTEKVPDTSKSDISHSNRAGPEDYYPGFPFTHDTTPDTLAITKLDPTPLDAVVEMLALVSPREDQVLYDLGCGDGRVLVAATSSYGCRSVGVELNPDSLEKAKIATLSFRDKIRLYLGDILDYSYPEADIVTMYLYPDLMKKVLPKLKSGTRVVSYLHEIPGGKKVQVREHTFYIWTKP